MFTFFWALPKRLWKNGFHLCDYIYVCQHICVFSYICVYRESADAFIFNFFQNMKVITITHNQSLQYKFQKDVKSL